MVYRSKQIVNWLNIVSQYLTVFYKIQSSSYNTLCLRI